MRHEVTAVCLALVLAALVTSLACDKTPTQSSQNTGMSLLSGRVTEGGFPLAQAKVEVTAAWGNVSKMTDSSGDYSGLMASGDVTLRAEKEGYSAQVKQLTVDHDQAVNFELQRVETPGDPQGVYTLIITASPSCTALPPEAMQRNYWARIDRTQDDLVVSLRGADFVSGWGQVGSAGFTGKRDGNTVRFRINDGSDPDYYFAVSLGAVRELDYSGVAIGTIGDKTIVAALDGTVRVMDFFFNSDPLTVAQCQARDHRLEFVR